MVASVRIGWCRRHGPPFTPGARHGVSRHHEPRRASSPGPAIQPPIAAAYSRQGRSLRLERATAAIGRNDVGRRADPRARSGRLGRTSQTTQRLLVSSYCPPAYNTRALTTHCLPVVDFDGSHFEGQYSAKDGGRRTTLPTARIAEIARLKLFGTNSDRSVLRATG